MLYLFSCFGSVPKKAQQTTTRQALETSIFDQHVRDPEEECLRFELPSHQISSFLESRLAAWITTAADILTDFVGPRECYLRYPEMNDCQVLNGYIGAQTFLIIPVDYYYATRCRFHRAIPRALWCLSWLDGSS